MLQMSPALLRRGHRVNDAIDVFTAIIEKNSLQKHTVKDWGEIYLPYLTDPEGWLGVWMLQSDELAVSMLGCRLWDAVYTKDSECVHSIRAIERTDCDAEGPVVDTYDQFPLAEELAVPFALRFAISNLSFLDSLIIEDNLVSIKAVTGFYDLEKPLEDGDVLPFQDRARLMAHHFNRYIHELNSEAAFGMALKLDSNREGQPQ